MLFINLSLASNNKCYFYSRFYIHSKLSVIYPNYLSLATKGGRQKLNFLVQDSTNRFRAFHHSRA